MSMPGAGSIVMKNLHQRLIGGLQTRSMAFSGRTSRARPTAAKGIRAVRVQAGESCPESSCARTITGEPERFGAGFSLFDGEHERLDAKGLMDDAHTTLYEDLFGRKKEMASGATDNDRNRSG